MPTYDYQCDACNHTFEEFQSMMDKHLKKCPQCKKNRLRRLLGTGSAIIFKGSGFYQTDYRSDSYKSAAKADEAKPASDKPAGDKPTTDKPAAKGTAPANDSAAPASTKNQPSSKSASKNTKSST